MRPNSQLTTNPQRPTLILLSAEIKPIVLAAVSIERTLEMLIGVIMVLVGIIGIRYAELGARIIKSPYAWFDLPLGNFIYRIALWGNRAATLFWLVSGVLICLGIVDILN